MKTDEIEVRWIRDSVELIEKEVVVRPPSSYYDRMVNLANEIGGDIIITPESFSTRIVWGVRKNAPHLLGALNEWILRMRKTTDYYVDL